MNKSRSLDVRNRDGGERRLMISGVLALDEPGGACTIIERGMSILNREGKGVGKVAAVSLDESDVVEAILLSRLPLKMEYRIVPANRIAAVRDREVVLDLAAGGVDALEKWSAR